MNGRRYNSKPGPAGQLEEGNLHFRLCHVCLTLNESVEEIGECVSCHHVFHDEIMMQFLDDNDDEAFSDSIEDSDVELEDMEQEVRRPTGNVQGLSVRF